MTSTRQAAVAGTFYPADSEELRSTVREFLDDADDRRRAESVKSDGDVEHAPKAIIVPHAGYVYSGPIAASAYARLRGLRDKVHRIVLLGPAHFVRVPGLAASSAESFVTPLGDIPVDVEAVAELLQLPQVALMDEAHVREHSLEVHLPFLQELFDDFSVVPLAVGQVTFSEVAEVLEKVWGGDETLVVISSDLSHYHDYATARGLDEATSREIEALHGEALRNDRACGALPIGGLLEIARRRGLGVATVDLRNSGDTAGSHDRVVGYGAYVVNEGDAPIRSCLEPLLEKESERWTEIDWIAEECSVLLELAERSIRSGVSTGKPINIELDEFSERLHLMRATFVTLRINGQLRGCMGTLVAGRPLAADVARNAYMAAFEDPRFRPMKADEVDGLDIHISILSPSEPIVFGAESELLKAIRPGIDGLILYEGRRRGTLLPSVWDSIKNPMTFLHQLKQKAGLPAAYWSPTIRVDRYTARSFGWTLADRELVFDD